MTFACAERGYQGLRPVWSVFSSRHPISHPRPYFLIAGSRRGCEVSSAAKACGNVAQLVTEECSVILPKVWLRRGRRLRKPFTGQRRV